MRRIEVHNNNMLVCGKPLDSIQNINSTSTNYDYTLNGTFKVHSLPL